MRFFAVHDRLRRIGAPAARPAAATAACALALAACGSMPATGSPAGPGSSPAPSGSGATARATGGTATAVCAASQLKVGMTHTGALGGQAGGYLRFTNEGTTACQLDGWPVVVALTASGRATTLKHAPSTMYGAWHLPSPLPLVRLAPGGSAYAVVAADDQPAGNAACPAPYVRLRVGPPGGPAGLAVSAWLPGTGSYLPACPSAAGTPTGEISAITPLSALPH
jgi:uncharacterized protein DUF4232